MPVGRRTPASRSNGPRLPARGLGRGEPQTESLDDGVDRTDRRRQRRGGVEMNGTAVGPERQRDLGQRDRPDRYLCRDWNAQARPTPKVQSGITGQQHAEVERHTQPACRQHAREEAVTVGGHDEGRARCLDPSLNSAAIRASDDATRDTERADLEPTPISISDRYRRRARLGDPSDRDGNVAARRRPGLEPVRAEDERRQRPSARELDPPAAALFDQPAAAEQVDQVAGEPAGMRRRGGGDANPDRCRRPVGGRRQLEADSWPVAGLIAGEIERRKRCRR